MKFKKFFSTAMVAALAVGTFSIPVSAAETTPWNTDGGTETIEGSAWVSEPIIEVELPGSLEFGVNPLMLNVSEDPTNPNKKQIVSGDYFVINASNVPVAVTVDTKITSESTANLNILDKTTMVAAKWDKNGANSNDALVAETGKKNIWLVQAYAKTITFANDAFSMTTGEITAGTTVGADVEGDTLTAASLTTPPVFALEALDETSATTIVKSVAGFRFIGAVDANAAFAEGDVKVSTVFTLKVLTEKQLANNYEDYKAENNTQGYTNVKKAK